MDNETAMVQDMMKSGDVAKYLGISKRHFDDLVAKGEFLQPFRLGKSTFWLKPQVRAYIVKLSEDAQRGPEAVTVDTQAAS